MPAAARAIRSWLPNRAIRDRVDDDIWRDLASRRTTHVPLMGSAIESTDFTRPLDGIGTRSKGLCECRRIRDGEHDEKPSYKAVGEPRACGLLRTPAAGPRGARPPQRPKMRVLAADGAERHSSCVSPAFGKLLYICSIVRSITITSKYSRVSVAPAQR